MNYKQYCAQLGYEDNGRRNWDNVKIRAAYAKAFRPFYTLNELGVQMGKSHATVMHYLKLKFPRDKFYESAFTIAEKLRGDIPEPQPDEKEVMVTNVINYDYLLDQNAKLVQKVKDLEAKLAEVKKYINGI
jgi:predicted transcriptional regulator